MYAGGVTGGGGGNGGGGKGGGGGSAYAGGALYGGGMVEGGDVTNLGTNSLASAFIPLLESVPLLEKLEFDTRGGAGEDDGVAAAAPATAASGSLISGRGEVSRPDGFSLAGACSGDGEGLRLFTTVPRRLRSTYGGDTWIRSAFPWVFLPSSCNASFALSSVAKVTKALLRRNGE